MSYSITIKFEVSGETTPLLPRDYIFAATSNPAVIEAGETATLKFKADGMYFKLKARNGASATGATLKWSCPSPNTDAEITLSNATSAVEITIIAIVSAAPQIVGKPFLYQLAAPVDTRLVLSKKEMCNISDNFLPNIYFALCKDDGHFYLYNKSVEKTSETGRYRLITDAIAPAIDTKINTAIAQDNVIEAETYYDQTEVKAEIEAGIDAVIVDDAAIEDLFK